MPAASTARTLYAAIERSARLVGAACARDRVWPVLSAYEDAIPADGGIVFSAETGKREAGELQYTIQLSGRDDPYERALSRRLLAVTDHPVGALLGELRQRVRVDIHAIDGGVVGGFRKVYALFPRDRQQVPGLAAVPSMPRALAANAELLARHGLTEATVVGVDYRHRTANVYFQLPGDGGLEPAAVRALLRDVGVAAPDERLVAYAGRAYRVYVTLDWDSPAVQRISFAPVPRRGLDLAALPARVEPGVERLMLQAPHTYPGERVGTTAVKWSADEAVLDLGAYYQMSPRQLTELTATGGSEE